MQLLWGHPPLQLAYRIHAKGAVPHCLLLHLSRCQRSWCYRLQSLRFCCSGNTIIPDRSSYWRVKTVMQWVSKHPVLRRPAQWEFMASHSQFPIWSRPSSAHNSSPMTIWLFTHMEFWGQQVLSISSLPGQCGTVTGECQLFESNRPGLEPWPITGWPCASGPNVWTQSPHLQGEDATGSLSRPVWGSVR